MNILIHAGFHKTATTTLQRTLIKNASVLNARLHFLIPVDLTEVIHPARRYSLDGNAKSSTKLRSRLIARLREIPSGSQLPLLVSCEDFSGMVPGRKGVNSYARTGDLTRVIVDAFSEALGENNKITV